MSTVDYRVAAAKRKQIDEMVKTMAEAPTGYGLDMWHSIATHLFEHGYRMNPELPLQVIRIYSGGAE